MSNPGNWKGHSGGVWDLATTVSKSGQLPPEAAVERGMFLTGVIWKAAKSPQVEDLYLSSNKTPLTKVLSVRTYSWNEWPCPFRASHISTGSFSSYLQRPWISKTILLAKCWVKRIALDCVNHTVRVAFPRRPPPAP
jgi:hypothetical protein